MPSLAKPASQPPAKPPDPAVSPARRDLPPPTGPVVMRQRWVDLLFLHWEVAAQEIAPTLPPGLRADTFGGKAYLGVVPFEMRGVRPVYLPAVPGLSNFGELNLRTYVVADDGTPGVWFYSLDAHQRLACAIARKFFRLPYHYAKIDAQHHGPRLDYHWHRPASRLSATSQASQAPAFSYTRPADPRPAAPGSLAEFLVERYVLFSYHPGRGQLYSGRVEHSPYRLATPAVDRYDTQLFPLNGLNPPATPPVHAAWSPQVDVQIYPLRQHGAKRD